MFVFPPKFICGKTNSQDDDIRRWGLWRGLGHEGRALMNEVRALVKETPEGSPTPLTT